MARRTCRPAPTKTERTGPVILNVPYQSAMKTILSRIQQLEQRCAARTAAANTSGVAKLKAKLDRMAERLRADPNWEPLSPSTAAEVRQRLAELPPQTRVSAIGEKA